MERDQPTALDDLIDLGAASRETKGEYPFAPEAGIGREPMGLSED
ncbi:benenodin family lasso peptide [Caulobacter flavus]|jgi:hypothetical protein|nr:benenodin family lasso peptide [Caulobacter flavus]